MATIQQIYENYIYSRSTYCSKETIKKYSDDLRLFSGSWNTGIASPYRIPVLMYCQRNQFIRDICFIAGSVILKILLFEAMPVP